MSRKFTLVLLISLLCTIPIFAQLVVIEDDYQIPFNISNNEFYLESLRLNKLAQDTYEYGDYDASAGFAQEAIRFALLSDEYVAAQLITEANRLLDLADSNNMAALYPDNYNEGKEYYEASVAANNDENWDEAISSAISSIEILSSLGKDRVASLPSQYTVRSWDTFKDCLWNIAGYSWIYGNPERWRVLFDANKSKMPDPNNPNWIEPGMVLDIPSIDGETRRGMWQPSN